MHQAIQRHEGVDQVSAHKIRLWDAEMVSNLIISDVVQNARRQQHAGRFSAYLSCDLIIADLVKMEIVNQSLAILTYELIANQSTNQDNGNLLQAASA
jgi:hypothetical protein